MLLHYFYSSKQKFSNSLRKNSLWEKILYTIIAQPFFLFIQTQGFASEPIFLGSSPAKNEKNEKKYCKITN